MKRKLNEEWTGTVVGKMHQWGVSEKELADRCGYTTQYVSMLLNGKKAFKTLKSPFYISKHRYLELKHFCLQYPEWKKNLSNLSYFPIAGDGRSTDVVKPVEKMAEKRDKYLRYMEMIEQAAIEADSDIYEWLIKAVAYGVSYSNLRAAGLPCSKDYYYDRYRRFFWCLDKVR